MERDGQTPPLVRLPAARGASEQPQTYALPPHQYVRQEQKTTLPTSKTKTQDTPYETKTKHTPSLRDRKG